ncbi:hypothetical protein SAMN05421541_106429 [Actinoplanes philippinensis]|uniref:Uncharacterized protein n=1 Tax=Actinoplanes philippinensis TaxID=35752 RepID=A0A1I2GBM2_9ACTN|nr:hypothetical protein [Actinoplanes philippinensis]SFF15154.1 hypothetical protein SAMN05421541_106429 [Actinoplanes philippinensis]
MVLATPVATSFLVGDQTDAEALALAAQGERLDYGLRPVTLGPAGDLILGIVACALVLLALGVLLRESVAGRLDRGWWWVLAQLMTIAVIVGFSWRVVTAGGIGANIGEGLVIIFFGPIALGLLIGSAVQADRLVKRHWGVDVG